MSAGTRTRKYANAPEMSPPRIGHLRESAAATAQPMQTPVPAANYSWNASSSVAAVGPASGDVSRV
jgi:hypothetical protein